ncbi:hypothetical protein KFK09_007660 [Dendrobium nobile]|uniref:flavanone 3-dioxygenase n=1 Tax=Dendrobium nobile TaxID=94219 RepID=A0A8T3BUY6_DENNO|nr:hypothetical protein KFK09_007660 [Dendrobium nobile]
MAPVPFLPTAVTEEKTLKESFVRDEDERPKVPYNVFSDEIPVISLQGMDEEGGEGGQRSEICRQIVAACEDWGIFQVVDHGLDAELIASMTRLAREFFALPAEEKLRFDMSGGKKGGFIVSSHLQGEVVQDWREIVTYFSYPIHARDYTRAGQARGELACNLLSVLSELGLDREAVTQACIEMDQKLVVNSTQSARNLITLGLKRHTDPGPITLLLQDQVGGLQATGRGATWITVQPVQNAFVVNLGDHGHYLSNGRFKNADHQAVVNSNCSRLSIATFQNPAPEAVVYPLAVREGERPVMEKAITFAEMYRRKMSRDLELARLKKMAKSESKQEEAAGENAEAIGSAATKPKALNEILA